MKFVQLTLFVIIVFTYTLSGCRKDHTVEPIQSDDTVVVVPFSYDSLYTVGKAFVNTNIVIYTIAQGDELSYDWSIDVGVLNNTADTAVFNTCCTGLYTVTCAVSDKHGNTASKSIQFLVGN